MENRFPCVTREVLSLVLKRVDAKGVAKSAVVGRIWNSAALLEQESVCRDQWRNMGYSENQLRSVLLALGGFRRLYSLYLGPLSSPNHHGVLSEDDLRRSLALLSIQFPEGEWF